jgi:hypothetical protein
MNEHIRKCCDGAGLDSNWKPGFDSIYGQQLEKFAELIVREVLDVIENERFEIYPPVVQRVKEHFGVEE